MVVAKPSQEQECRGRSPLPRYGVFPTYSLCAGVQRAQPFAGVWGVPHIFTLCRSAEGAALCRGMGCSLLLLFFERARAGVQRAQPFAVVWGVPHFFTSSGGGWRKEICNNPGSILF